jgi:hypothetical protein
MTFSFFTLDNIFISRVLCIFTPLITNQLLVVIKENLIAELTFIFMEKPKLLDQVRNLMRRNESKTSVRTRASATSRNIVSKS